MFLAVDPELPRIQRRLPVIRILMVFIERLGQCVGQDVLASDLTTTDTCRFCKNSHADLLRPLRV